MIRASDKAQRAPPGGKSRSRPSRASEVQEYDLGFLGSRKLQGSRPVVRHGHVVAAQAQQLRQAAGGVAVVVHHEDATGGR